MDFKKNPKTTFKAIDRLSKKEAAREIEALGEHTTSSVSGGTDYLVVGKNPGSKLDKAREHKVKILKEDAFRSMIGDN